MDSARRVQLRGQYATPQGSQKGRRRSPVRTRPLSRRRNGGSASSARTQPRAFAVGSAANVGVPAMTLSMQAMMAGAASMTPNTAPRSAQRRSSSPRARARPGATRSDRGHARGGGDRSAMQAGSSGGSTAALPLEAAARIRLLEGEQAMHLNQIGQLSRSVAQLANENQRLRAAAKRHTSMLEALPQSPFGKRSSEPQNAQRQPSQALRYTPARKGTGSKRGAAPTPASRTHKFATKDMAQLRQRLVESEKKRNALHRARQKDWLTLARLESELVSLRKECDRISSVSKQRQTQLDRRCQALEMERQLELRAWQVEREQLVLALKQRAAVLDGGGSVTSYDPQAAAAATVGGQDGGDGGGGGLAAMLSMTPMMVPSGAGGGVDTSAHMDAGVGTGDSVVPAAAAAHLMPKGGASGTVTGDSESGVVGGGDGNDGGSGDGRSEEKGGEGEAGSDGSGDRGVHGGGVGQVMPSGGSGSVAGVGVGGGDGGDGGTGGGGGGGGSAGGGSEVHSVVGSLRDAALGAGPTGLRSGAHSVVGPFASDPPLVSSAMSVDAADAGLPPLGLSGSRRRRFAAAEKRRRRWQTASRSTQTRRVDKRDRKTQTQKLYLFQQDANVQTELSFEPYVLIAEHDFAEPARVFSDTPPPLLEVGPPLHSGVGHGDDGDGDSLGMEGRRSSGSEGGGSGIGGTSLPTSVSDLPFHPNDSVSSAAAAAAAAGAAAAAAAATGGGGGAGSAASPLAGSSTGAGTAGNPRGRGLYGDRVRDRDRNGGLDATAMATVGDPEDSPMRPSPGVDVVPPYVNTVRGMDGGGSDGVFPGLSPRHSLGHMGGMSPESRRQSHMTEATAREVDVGVGPHDVDVVSAMAAAAGYGRDVNIFDVSGSEAGADTLRQNASLSSSHDGSGHVGRSSGGGGGGGGGGGEPAGLGPERRVSAGTDYGLPTEASSGQRGTGGGGGGVPVDGGDGASFGDGGSGGDEDGVRVVTVTAGGNSRHEPPYDAGLRRHDGGGSSGGHAFSAVSASASGDSRVRFGDNDSSAAAMSPLHGSKQPPGDMLAPGTSALDSDGGGSGDGGGKARRGSGKRDLTHWQSSMSRQSPVRTVDSLGALVDELEDDDGYDIAVRQLLSSNLSKLAGLFRRWKSRTFTVVVQSGIITQGSLTMESVQEVVLREFNAKGKLKSEVGMRGLQARETESNRPFSFEILDTTTGEALLHVAPHRSIGERDSAEMTQQWLYAINTLVPSLFGNRFLRGSGDDGDGSGGGGGGAAPRLAAVPSSATFEPASRVSRGGGIVGVGVGAGGGAAGVDADSDGDSDGDDGGDGAISDDAFF